MSATPSIVIGKEGFGIKNGNLLGYYRADDGIYVARQFTATRGGGTNGTFVNSSGLIEVAASPNLPRIDFSSGSKAVLIEPAATNLALYSEEFDDAYWGKGGGTTVTGNTNIAPDGTLTADSINIPSGGTINKIFIGFSITSGNAYTFSCYVRSATRAITFGGATGGAGTVVYNGAVDVGNGWFRQSVTRTWSASGTFNIQLVWTESFGFAYGDIWGAQLETGAVATSYIPTTTGTITRNADVITLANASEYIGQTEGTIYTEINTRIYTGISSRRIISLRVDGNNLISLEIIGSNILGLIITNGGSSVSLSYTIPSDGTYKVAAGYNNSTNGTSLYVNGNLIGTTTAVVPNLSSASFGYGTRADGAAGTQFGDRIRAAAIYTTRLSDAQLIDMTWQ